jgi:hypothetical protein
MFNNISENHDAYDIMWEENCGTARQASDDNIKAREILNLHAG